MPALLYHKAPKYFWGYPFLYTDTQKRKHTAPPALLRYARELEITQTGCNRLKHKLLLPPDLRNFNSHLRL